MIKNFEERYEKLLREAEKGPIVMLPSIEGRGGNIFQAQPVITSKTEIDCAKNACIENKRVNEDPEFSKLWAQ